MPYISFAFSSSRQHWLHDVLKNEPPKCSFGRWKGIFSFFFNLCSNFKHGHKDYIFILLHKGSEQVLMLTEHFMWYLATKKETLSAQNSQEHSWLNSWHGVGKLPQHCLLSLIFPYADTSDALKVAVLTSSAAGVKEHSQSSHAKMRKTYCNAQKT